MVVVAAAVVIAEEEEALEILLLLLLLLLLLRALLPQDTFPPHDAVETIPAPTNEFFAATRRCDSSLSFRI